MSLIKIVSDARPDLGYILIERKDFDPEKHREYVEPSVKTETPQAQPKPAPKAEKPQEEALLNLNKASKAQMLSARIAPAEIDKILKERPLNPDALERLELPKDKEFEV